MDVNYNKLFKLLIDKGMKNKDLREKAAISESTMAKLSKNENGFQYNGKLIMLENGNIQVIRLK